MEQGQETDTENKERGGGLRALDGNEGERDYQVTMQDFELWQSALAKHPNAIFKSYPRLNHLFQEGEGKSTPLEYSRPSSIPSYVTDDIAAFINRPKPGN